MTEEALVKTVNAPEGTTCLCNNAECSALTYAFRMMGDARKRFVVLPPYLEKGSSPHRNKQRESYLRYLLPKHNVKKPTTSNYIALHHFHAQILWDAFQVSNSIPKTLSCGQAVELRMKLSEKDKCVDETGMPAFYYCPNYPLEQVKRDLEELSPPKKIQEDPSVDHDSNREVKKQPTTFEDIPKHVHVDNSDADSDMSSIEIIVDKERDIVTLTLLVGAATKCQSFIRRCQAVYAVAEMRKKRDAVVTLQSLVRMHIARQDYRHKREAAILIQTAWRDYHGITSLERMASCAVSIQRVVRGHQARVLVRYTIPYQHAVVIQKNWRRSWVQGAYQLYLSDVVVVQRFVRQRAAAREVQDRRVSILMLQTNTRRWSAERSYNEQRDAAVAIQSKWRQHVAYESFHMKPDSAVVIQTAARGMLARQHVHARTASALKIQKALRRNWHQIRENRVRKQAAITIQAIVRGFLCRKKTGWMVMFAMLKAMEQYRRKVYNEILDDAVTAWMCCLEMLDDGIEEIERAKRLIVGASLADQAFAAALRSIAQDDFVHDEFGGGLHPDAEQARRHRGEDYDMPTDPVLNVLLNADAKMADRFDDMSGSGLSEVGPELDSFRMELETQVASVKRTGSVFVKSMPTPEMKAASKATQEAWEELEAVVQERWKGGDESLASTKSGGAIRTTPPGLDTAQDKGTNRRSKRDRTQSDDKLRGSEVQTATTPVRSDRESESKSEDSPPVKTPVRRTSRPVDMGFSSATSPQSVIAGVEGGMSSPKSGPKRDLMSTSPSSRRLLFGRQGSSFDDFSLVRDLSADECIAIVSQDGAQKHGIDFFDFVSSALSTKSTPPTHPEWPSLNRSSSYSSSTSVKDRWLLEANYRAAAAHQALVWNSFLGLLSKMCDAVKEIELQRCAKLNSTVLVAVPLERRILMEMREVQEDVVQELLAFRHDREYLSDSVDTMVEHHAQLLRQRDSDPKSSVLDQFGNLAPMLSRPIESLEAESTYGVTHHAMVVERSVGRRSWKTTLVVATADRYMHLFDLSSISDIEVGSSPNEAFDLLLPEEHFTGDQPIRPREEKLLQHLSPVSTVNLRKCRILTTDWNSVEVTEKIPGILRTSTRKFLLRGEADDLARWKQFLTRKTP